MTGSAAGSHVDWLWERAQEHQILGPPDTQSAGGGQGLARARQLKRIAQPKHIAAAKAYRAMNLCQLVPRCACGSASPVYGIPPPVPPPRVPSLGVELYPLCATPAPAPPPPIYQGNSPSASFPGLRTPSHLTPSHAFARLLRPCRRRRQRRPPLPPAAPPRPPPSPVAVRGRRRREVRCARGGER